MESIYNENNLEGKVENMEYIKMDFDCEIIGNIYNNSELLEEE